MAATTRLDIQTRVYNILQKSATAYGLLDPTKVSDAINDALDFTATMMNNVSSAWITKNVKLNIVAGVATITLPVDCVMINYVKKLNFGTQYIPLVYDESANVTTGIETMTTANYTPTYRLSEGKLMLEPGPTEALANGIMLDYVSAPTALTADNSTVFLGMDYPVFMQFVKWRAASILWSTTHDQAMSPPWAESEGAWLQLVKRTIAKRILKPSLIQGMTDY
jgi:hypothetical protein